MDVVLTEMLDYLNNYFVATKLEGNFVIQDHTISVEGLKEGQYFRILGSTFNDGVHKYPIDTAKMPLTDEEFKGQIWLLAIPATVLSLASDIKSWQTAYGSADSAAMSPFNSESFSGYSYSKSGGGSVSGGGMTTWQDAFAGRLNKYRKLRGCR